MMEILTVTERRNKIIELLNENGKVNVNELSNMFGVSGVAIRTDLTELEKQDLLTRVHGGAITTYKSYYDMNFVQRANTNAKEKECIANHIAKMIKNNSTIMMNAGTTPIFVMRALKDKKVTIVTNSIALAVEGAKNHNFKIILLGGDVNSDYQFTYGVTALKSLEQYSADVFIMSVDGIDATKGVSTFYYQEAEICNSMIEHSKKTIITADYSKFGRTAFANIGNLTNIDAIITNETANTGILNSLYDKKVKIIIAK
ncbi:MAG: DeoR/GlpR transcriptional regulator [Clostridia bacterium]|nr:DeoR/GlpR transcriptional regulator [Clostridia bacterium]